MVRFGVLERCVVVGCGARYRLEAVVGLRLLRRLLRHVQLAEHLSRVGHLQACIHGSALPLVLVGFLTARRLQRHGLVAASVLIALHLPQLLARLLESSRYGIRTMSVITALWTCRMDPPVELVLFGVRHHLALDLIDDDAGGAVVLHVGGIVIHALKSMLRYLVGLGRVASLLGCSLRLQLRRPFDAVFGRCLFVHFPLVTELGLPHIGRGNLLGAAIDLLAFLEAPLAPLRGSHATRRYVD